MNIIFIDDELSAHINFRAHMEEQKGITTLHCFFTAEEALVHAQHNHVDCAITDINLSSQINGLELARRLKTIQPQIEVAFLTAFDEYTKTSYEIGGRAYLTKPFSQEEFNQTLHLLKRLIHPATPAVDPATPPTAPQKPQITVRTFGNFDLMIDQQAVAFQAKKAKEALAFLIHQSGGSVSGAQIFFALWEFQEYTRSTSIYVRRTIRALKTDLENLGIDHILICGRNSYSVDMTQLTCDSQALLRGDEKAAAFYNGEYMRQYSWAENTVPLLDRAAEKILKHSLYQEE